jgi:hypothetical protein
MVGPLAPERVQRRAYRGLPASASSTPPRTRPRSAAPRPRAELSDRRGPRVHGEPIAGLNSLRMALTVPVRLLTVTGRQRTPFLSAYLR